MTLTILGIFSVRNQSYTRFIIKKHFMYVNLQLMLWIGMDMYLLYEYRDLRVVFG